MKSTRTVKLQLRVVVTSQAGRMSVWACSLLMMDPSWALYSAINIFTRLVIPILFDFVTKLKGNKQQHLTKIKKESGLEFSDMIFFDDQMGNIKDVSQLGVTSVLTPRGVTRALFDKGLKSYANGERGVIIK